MKITRDIIDCDYDLTVIAFTHMYIELKGSDRNDIIESLMICNITCQIKLWQSIAIVQIDLSDLTEVEFNNIKNVLVKQNVKKITLK